MANQTGIAITIKAFLPTGKTLDEVFAALSIVKDAHATGDYSAVLRAALVEEAKTEQKTRRVEDAVQQPATNEPGLVEKIDALTEDASGLKQAFDDIPVDDKPTIEQMAEDAAGYEAVPEFIKKGKAKAA